MTDVDLNLLPALDALLTERSVTRAAARLGLSTSAMSRTLARLREMTGDQLLVRAGNALVPTPRAEALRARTGAVAREARELLRPQVTELDLASLERSFVIRANAGFVTLFAATLISAIGTVAPGVQVRFVSRTMKNADPLREAQVDLDIGVLGASAPEVRTRVVFRDRFVGVARDGHPLLAGRLTARAYARCRHVVASRKTDVDGPVDHALQQSGLRRRVVAVVSGFPDAVGIARESDVIAQVPRSLLCARLPSAKALAQGVTVFELPVPTPEIAVSAMWHPRLDADPAHRWLREWVIGECLRALGD